MNGSKGFFLCLAVLIACLSGSFAGDDDSDTLDIIDLDSNEIVSSSIVCPTGYDQLPKEVKLQILSHCDIPTLGRAAQLGQCWKKVSEKNILWKSTPFLHKPLGQKDNWKECSKENHQLAISSFPKIKSHIRREKFKKKIRIHSKTAFPDPSNLNPFKQAIKLWQKRKYERVLAVLNYASDAEINSSMGFSLLADSFYFTGQNEEAKHYYTLLYKNKQNIEFIDNRVIYSAINNNNQYLEVLLSSGADVDQRDSIFGSTALMWASQKGYSDIVRLLLYFGADLNARSMTGHQYTAFDFAMEKVNVDILRAMLDAGLDIETRHTQWGSTALMFAAQQGNFEAVRLLLERGADLNARSLGVNHWTAFDFASNNEEVLKVLKTDQINKDK
jgi:hypothetical protein